ncbi:MADS-box transcription factor PHERES 1-like [Salvia divinorum]|uniref:MADS-box transcription factor PHERES 1-like n=1 Tax=Salvia divinorum TaxID=28513 RepID=A0ABD1IBH4_SALDI
MTRGSIKHEEIPNEYRRNAMFRKRQDGLLKKANELSILCGVEVGIVVHRREQSNAVLWPSPESFGSRLQKFREFRKAERERRITTHEGLMKEMVQGEMENVEKLRSAVRLKESRQLVVESMQTGSINGFGIEQLIGMSSFADHMIKKLQQRDNEVVGK